MRTAASSAAWNILQREMARALSCPMRQNSINPHRCLCSCGCGVYLEWPGLAGEYPSHIPARPRERIPTKLTMRPSPCPCVPA